MLKSTTFLPLFGLLSVFVLVSCEPAGEKYTTGTFPDSPVNFSEMNTEYDDYNSAFPEFGETFPLCFSSTRNGGSGYDFVYKLMSIQFSKITGKLDIFENVSTGLDVYTQNTTINNALNKINTPFDEFGPYLVPRGLYYNEADPNTRYQKYVFLYSNNSSGNQDIKFTDNLTNINFEQPTEVRFLNSSADDAYPTFSKDFSEIYFTSNRGGSFDIYKASIDTAKEIVDVLKNTTEMPVQKDAVLSSESDDKCPFISNDMLVFTSNRTGGYGGFDLYYSRRENGKWSTPVNFGPKINTAYDEYRPIIRPEYGFTNDFMLFSSNRPGGKGGFDLYYVGIDKFLK